MKKTWITPSTNNRYFSISMESNGIADHQKIFTRSLKLPAKNKGEPELHVVILSTFTQDDINMLAKELDKWRTDV